MSLRIAVVWDEVQRRDRVLFCPVCAAVRRVVWVWAAMLPHGGAERDKPLLRLKFNVFVAVTVCLPLFGFFTCVIISLLYHYNEATYTHCQVCNIFTLCFMVIFICTVSNIVWSVKTARYLDIDDFYFINSISLLVVHVWSNFSFKLFDLCFMWHAVGLCWPSMILQQKSLYECILVSFRYYR